MQVKCVFFSRSWMLSCWLISHNKKHLCYAASRVSRIKNIPSCARKSAKLALLLRPQARKPGRAWKLLPPLLPFSLDFQSTNPEIFPFFRLLFFLTTESSGVVKKGAFVTTHASRSVKVCAKVRTQQKSARNRRIFSLTRDDKRVGRASFPINANTFLTLCAMWMLKDHVS